MKYFIIKEIPPEQVAALQEGKDALLVISQQESYRTFATADDLIPASRLRYGTPRKDSHSFSPKVGWCISNCDWANGSGTLLILDPPAPEEPEETPDDRFNRKIREAFEEYKEATK